MNEYQICSRCVMDTTVHDISFDENGICNYCTTFKNKLDVYKNKAANLQLLRDALLSRIKRDGKGKEYDCIIGVSGGVDSSYALYLAVKNGLRPLAVHLDNGWNSELATHNISNLVNKLGVDLFTHVIDWEENRDLQLSFFKANVVDIELLMDNAMLAINYQMAKKYKLKYILAGSNTLTEGMRMPPKWAQYKYDVKNIKSIHKKFGHIPIKTHPLFSSFDCFKYRVIYKIQWTPLLDYFPYNKFSAIDILQKECDYKPYPYKHYESVFTRFYQGYILPKKFGYDKRLVHLSELIMSEQLSREEALNLLKNPPYPDPKQEEQDRIFVMKKLGFTEETWEEYIHSSEVPHSTYGSEKWILDFVLSLSSLLNRKGIIKGSSPFSIGGSKEILQ